MTHYDQSTGTLTLHNYMDFVDLTDYATLSYELNCDGQVVSAGSVPFPGGFRLPPHADGTLPLPLDVPAKGKCFVNIFTTANRMAH